MRPDVEREVVIGCPRMHPVLARLRSVSTVVAVLLIAVSALAEDAVDRAAKKLKTGEDFRVRTQAALSLGSSKSKRAVEPLCGGLEDESTTVRAASAAALGKLKLGGKECLEKRLEDESSGTVKSSIKKALAQIKAGSAPEITKDTKYYIAFAKVTDKTGRKDKSVDKLVRKAMEKAAQSFDGAVVAPADEKPADAKKLLAKFKKVKGFYLSPKVMEPRYQSGSLQIKVEIAIFTYPGKALKGNIPVKLTQEGVSGSDQDSEDELIKMASERAMEKFSQNAERIE
jgi:hypothetical protein